MPAQVLVKERDLPSTRLLTLPNSFTVCINVHSTLGNLNSGGDNNSLSANDVVQDGGDNTSLFFFTKIENPN